MVDHRIGSWAFILGVLIAVIGGAIGGYVTALGPGITLLLVILGLVIGFLNVGHKEVNDFLIAAIALTLVGAGGSALININILITPLGTVLNSIVSNIAALVAPAALVVALTAVYNLARTPA